MNTHMKIQVIVENTWKKTFYGDWKFIIEQKQNSKEVTINWDLLRENINNQTHLQIWKDVENSFNKIAEDVKIKQEVKKSFERTDWDELEELYGEEEITSQRIQFNEFLNKSLPEVDMTRVREHVHSIFNPLVDKMKDQLIDYFPQVEEGFKRAKFILPLLKLDKYGLPAYNFFTDFAIIDDYFPALRDKVIEEVENEDYSLEIPKGTPTIDDLNALMHKTKLIERENLIFKQFEDSNTSTSQGNKRKDLIEQSLRRLQQLVDEKKAVDGEVAQLRTKTESIETSVPTGAAAAAGAVVAEVHVETKKKFSVDEFYEVAEKYGISKEMCNPILMSKKSQKEINEMSKKVREDYFKRTGTTPRTDELPLNSF